MTARRRFIAQSAALAALPFISTSTTRALAAASGPKLGFALCGLGNLSEHVIAPSLLKTKRCRLTGLITDSPAKAIVWQKQYGIPSRNVYTYDTMARMADNPDIDVVYVMRKTTGDLGRALPAAHQRRQGCQSQTWRGLSLPF
jgi:hypothetical protein